MLLVSLFALVVGLSFSAQAQETTSPAATSALILLEELKATPTKVIGLQARSQDEESFVQTRLQSPDLKTLDANFECHGDHCHAVDKKERMDLTLATAAFDNEALINSLSQALDIFARKVAPTKQIESVKIWQNDDEIYLTLSQATSAAYFMCHVHGGDHFDCHRSRTAGPEEPQW